MSHAVINVCRSCLAPSAASPTATFELRLRKAFVSFGLSFIKQYSSCNLFINLAVCITIAAERLCAWNEVDLVEIRGMEKVLVLNCLLYSFGKKKNYLDFWTFGVQGGKNFLFSIESYIQGVSRLVDITAGGDFLGLYDQKSSYKHVSDFGQSRSYDRLKLRIEGNDY